MVSVFISYAHENAAAGDQLRAQVRELATYLRANQCQVQCDLDHPNRPPPEGWQVWMAQSITKSHVVLMVCTPKYRQRFENAEIDDTGRGVRFEGAIITQALYQEGMRNNRKYFPIQPDGEPIESVPTIVRPWLHSHCFPSGKERILALVLGDDMSGHPDAKTRNVSDAEKSVVPSIQGGTDLVRTLKIQELIMKKSQGQSSEDVQSQMAARQQSRPNSGRRFRIAFSFAGEKRAFVEQVAELLKAQFGEEAILYDKYHEAEFARHDLGIYLPLLYGEQSDLIVPVLCKDYDQKRWTGWEWLHIYGLLNKADGQRVMPSRFDRAIADGLSPTSGFIELDQKTPKQFVTLILQRLAINEGRSRDHYSGELIESSANPVGQQTIHQVSAPQQEALAHVGWRYCRTKPEILEAIERRVRTSYNFDKTWAQNLLRSLNAKDHDLVTVVRDHPKPRDVIDQLTRTAKAIQPADIVDSGVDELLLLAACRCMQFAPDRIEPVGEGTGEASAAITKFGSDLDLLSGICVAAYCSVRLYVNESKPDMGYTVHLAQGNEGAVLHAAVVELYPQILGKVAPAGRSTANLSGDLGLWFEDQREIHNRAPLVTVLCNETAGFHRTIAIHLAKQLNHVVNYRREDDPPASLEIDDKVEIFHARIKRCLESILQQAANR